MPSHRQPTNEPTAPTTTKEASTTTTPPTTTTTTATRLSYHVDHVERRDAVVAVWDDVAPEELADALYRHTSVREGRPWGS
jgi:hypothetical protein